MLLCIIVLLHIYQLKASDDFFDEGKENIKLNTNPLSKLTTSKLMGCLIACIQYGRHCKSINYNMDNHECYLYQVTLTKVGNSCSSKEYSWIYYEKVSMFH